MVHTAGLSRTQCALCHPADSAVGYHRTRSMAHPEQEKQAKDEEQAQFASGNIQKMLTLKLPDLAQTVPSKPHIAAFRTCPVPTKCTSEEQENTQR